MDEGPVSPRHASAIQHGPERRARWYLFGVCCGAMFLLSIALGMRPTETEPLAAALVFPSLVHQDKYSTVESPVEEIRSAAQLAPAVRQFVSPSSSEKELVTHFTRETSATLSPLDASGIQRLLVSYTGQRPEAVKVLNSLVESYAGQLRARHKEAHDHRYQQAVEKANAAQDKTNTARDRLAAQRAMVDRDEFAAHHAGASAVGESSLPKLRMEPNPAWVELSKQLHETEQQRRELLTQLNEVHPRIKDIEYKISSLRQQLSGVPETLTQVGTKEPAQAADSGVVARAAKLKRLENELEAAQMAQQLAEQELAAAQDAVGQVAVDPTRVVLWAAPLPPAGSGVPTLVFAMLLAVVSAGGIALVAVPENPTFRTVDLAADTLAVPVVGVIHASGETPWLNRAELPGWTRVVQRSAEGVLLLSVVMGMLFWLSGTELSARIARGLRPAPTTVSHETGR